MIRIEETQFQREVIESNDPVVVEFFTDWSGSAYIITGLLNELEREYSGLVKFVNMDFDKSKQFCETYRITKIPTILFFKNGEAVEILQGTHSRSAIIEIIDLLINKN